MKLIGSVFAILTALLVAIYLFLFTSLGHGIILPMIEGKIKEATKLQNVNFESFDLSPSSLNTILLVENNPIKLDANFSLFAKTLDATYKVDINDLSSFKELIQQPLQGTFSTQGKVKGHFEDLSIKGIAKVAKGDIAYDLNIATNNINNINFTVSDLDISTLLSMVGQPKYIEGLLQSKGKISSLKLENIDFLANVNQGKINTSEVKKAFNIQVPPSDFKLNSKIDVNDQKGNYIIDINSSLAKIKSDGKLDLSKMGIDAKYALNVQSLGVLEPMIATKLNGSFETSGSIQGDQKNMNIKGKSSLASGNTTYDVTLKDMNVDKLTANIKNAKLDQLLHMLNQPKYAQGLLTVNANIDSLKNLKGNIKTRVNDGLINRSVMKKQFEMNFPSNSTFNAKINTDLNKNSVISDIDLNSFAADITTKKTQFLIDSAKLTTDYTLSVSNLGKLYFLTNQKMKGDLKVTGDVTFDKTLLATCNTKKFGGTVNGKLDDNKLNVVAKDLKTLPLLDMMYYPQIFRSSLNANVDYDLATKQGLSKVDMSNGQFLTNEAMTMLKNLTSYDLTLEVYKTANLTTKINDTILKNDLFMESAKSTIKSNKLVMNTKNSTIDGDIDIKYRKYELGIELNGPIASPNVKVDPGNALKQKAKEKVNKLIDEKLDGKVDENVKGLLKGLFQ